MKYILGFFVTILLIILLVILLVTGGDDKKPTVPNTSKALSSYANTDTVSRLTIDGPINAPQDHVVTRVTVGRDSTQFEQIVGYQEQAVKIQTFANSQASYEAFLKSIERAGFTQGDTSAELKDEKGRCPLGKRYIFELIQNGKPLQRFWSTSCKGDKSYLGNASLTTTLFQRQVPGYSKLANALPRNNTLTR